VRCKACNINLTDQEAVKKDKQTGEFLDLCLGCLYGSEDDESVDIEHYYFEQKEWDNEDPVS